MIPLMIVTGGTSRAKGPEEKAFSGLLYPHSAIECAVLERLLKVNGTNIRAVVDIRYRPGHFKDSVVGSRTEMHIAHGESEDLARLLIEKAVFLDFSATHHGVEQDLAFAGETFGLNSARLNHGFAHFGARLTFGYALQILKFCGWHLDVDVYPVKKRS